MQTMVFFLTKYCHLLTVAALLCCFMGVSATTNTAPKHEVRAVWLTTLNNLDWPKRAARTNDDIERQKTELREILDSLKAININMVMLQARVRATTIYPSAIEPRDRAIMSEELNWDPLQYAIEECHKRGMELHAWVVTIPIGKWNSQGCKQLRKTHPRLVRRIKGEGFMNPEVAQTGDYIANICGEITDKYDIDGIHLDYIRYPETWTIKKTQRAKAQSNITSIVRKINARVKSRKPWVKVSCSPIGKYSDLARYSSYGWNARDRVAQDAQMWLKEGLMDMLMPMMYFDGKHFYPFVMDWMENDNGRIIAAGLGTYMLHAKEKNWELGAIERQINVARKAGMGHAHFRTKFLLDNTKGVYDHSKDNLNRYPALVPPMTWESTTPPPSPDSVCIVRISAGDELSWDAVTDSDGKQLFYNVYASTTFPVDINNPENLIATRITEPVLTIPATAKAKRDRPVVWHYAVTTMDRYGNESQPSCTKDTEKPLVWQTTIINDGKILNIPTDHTMFDAAYASIETLQGKIMAVKPYNHRPIDISEIPEGFYQVKSIGRKGVTHRLGFFTIKR